MKGESGKIVEKSDNPHPSYSNTTYRKQSLEDNVNSQHFKEVGYRREHNTMHDEMTKNKGIISTFKAFVWFCLCAILLKYQTNTLSEVKDEKCFCCVRTLCKH